MIKSCHRCQLPWVEPAQPGFNNTCPQCGMALHACSNCQHFVTSGSVRCLVPEASEVQDPQSGNRCHHFEFGNSTPTASRNSRSSDNRHLDLDGARRKWDELFGESAN